MAGAAHRYFPITALEAGFGSRSTVVSIQSSTCAMINSADFPLLSIDGPMTIVMVPGHFFKLLRGQK